MTRHVQFAVTLAMAAGLAASAARAAQTASPSAEAALKLKPVQAGVDYDQPTAQEAANCTISAKKLGGHVGWVVEDPRGFVLRQYSDTNGDNVVDQWCYYKDGLEVYRDIDANFNGKADQCRWFHTEGTRWGLDQNEDGKVDAWKTISPEEVSAEVVRALAERNSERFAAVTLTPAELKTLGLGDEKAAELGQKIAGLADKFAALAGRQQVVGPETEWVQFSGMRPGVVPAGTAGSTKDVRVYENVVAVVATGNKHGQVQIGTLVAVGDAWKLIDLPQPLAEGQAEVPASGFFFQASLVNRPDAGLGQPAEAAQQLLGELEQLDTAAAQATRPEQQAEFNAKRADLIEKIAAQAASPKDREMWLRQLADMVSAAVQSGTYPDGAARLAALFEKLGKNADDKDLAAYVKFRQLTAEYGLALQAPKADFAKIQTEWLANLEKYVKDYPTSPDAAEAMLQLGIAQEFSGQEDEAKAWYGRIVSDFPNSAAAQKAAGARTRLDSVGKAITLTGKSPSGSPVDLADYRGKVVLIQYWATWCDPAKADMAVIRELLAKYGKSLAVIGVSLDSDPKALSEFLATAKLPWAQIYEEGGLDSRPANHLGILTLPTMILVDQQGRVVNRNIQSSELEQEVAKLIK
jgi:thiol-disulfide isomerase/thioredoxin